MIKHLADMTVAFDAEWVPCPTTGRKLLGLSNHVPDRRVMEAMWAAYANEPGQRPFLKLALCKVVSIAALVRVVQHDRIRLSLRTFSVDAMNEGEIIQAFLEGVAQGYQLWGYNSANADLPILLQRGLAQSVCTPGFGMRPARPWLGMDYFARASEAHVDILQVIGGYSGAAKPSLHELAVACGLPGKLGVSGADVADLYLAGDIPAIADYNQTDAVTTHLLMLRIGLMSGQLTPEAFHREVEAVEALLDKERRSSPQLTVYWEVLRQDRLERMVQQDDLRKEFFG